MKVQLNFLIEKGKAWIISQRSLHHPHAEPLSADHQGPLKEFFNPDILATFRVRRVPIIENPDFYTTLEHEEQPTLLDFRAMEGITFMDTILIAEQKIAVNDWRSLLFHECVHGVQYRLLGLDVFVEQYVHGWAAYGFDYHSIPLEKDAYELQHAFESAPDRPFSVELEVKRIIGKRGTLLNN